MEENHEKRKHCPFAQRAFASVFVWIASCICLTITTSCWKSVVLMLLFLIPYETNRYHWWKASILFTSGGESWDLEGQVILGRNAEGGGLGLRKGRGWWLWEKGMEVSLFPQFKFKFREVLPSSNLLSRNRIEWEQANKMEYGREEKHKLSKWDSENC